MDQITIQFNQKHMLEIYLGFFKAQTSKCSKIKKNAKQRKNLYIMIFEKKNNFMF